MQPELLAWWRTCYNEGMARWLFIVELLFLSTFWLQTRFNLLRLFPGWQAPDPSIDYLIPFIYLTDSLFFIVLIAWAMQWWQGGKRLQVVTLDRYSLVIQPLFWAILLLLVAALSLVINDGGAWGWYRWMKLLEAMLVGWWVAMRWRDEKRRFWYGCVLLVGLGLESWLLVGEWLTQSSFGLQWLGEWRFDVLTPGVAKIEWQGQQLLRPMATFAHPNIAAGVLVASLPLAGVWVRAARKRINEVDHWWFYIGYRLALLGYVAAIILTFSRSAWVSFLAIAGLYAGYRLDWSVLRRWSAWMKVRWSAIAAVLGGIFLWPMVAGRFTSLATTDSWSLGLRWQLSDIAWHVWQSSPWVGIGLNSFTLHISTTFYGGLVWNQPVHSVGLLILAELGAMGLLAVAGLCLSVLTWPFLVAGHWRSKTESGILVILLTWMAVVLLSLTDHYWWTSQPGILLVGGLLGGTWLLQHGKRQKEAADEF